MAKKNQESAPSLEALQADLLAANSACAEKDLQIKDALAVNERLQEKLEELERQIEASAKAGKPIAAAPAKKAQVPTESFTSGDQAYVFTVPAFSLGGKKILASEALSDQALLDELVTMGYGGIKIKGS